MHPVCRSNCVRPTSSVRPFSHKHEPKISPSRHSFSSPLPVHACAARWKSSIQHLPTSPKNHSYEIPEKSPTALSATHMFEKVITRSAKPAAALTPIQKPKVYGDPFDDPHALMTIDDRYPDRLKEQIKYANTLKIVPGSEELNLSGCDFPDDKSDPSFAILYKRMVADSKFNEDARLKRMFSLKNKET